MRGYLSLDQVDKSVLLVGEKILVIGERNYMYKFDGENLYMTQQDYNPREILDEIMTLFPDCHCPNELPNHIRSVLKNQTIGEQL